MKRGLFFLFLWTNTLLLCAQVSTEADRITRALKAFKGSNSDSVVHYLSSNLEAKLGSEVSLEVLETVSEKDFGKEMKTALLLRIAEIYMSKEGANLLKAEKKLQEGYEMTRYGNPCRAILFLEAMLRLQGLKNMKSDSLTTMMYLIDEAIEKSNCPERKADVYVNLADKFYNPRKDYFRSLDLLEKAYWLADSLSLSNFRKGQILDLKAYTYYQIQNYDLALLEWQRAINTWKSSDIKNRQYTNILNSIGLAYKFLNKHDSALFYHEKALENARKLQDTIWIGILSGNLGEVYYLQKNYERALQYKTEGFEICKKFGAWSNAVFFAFSIADIYLDLKQPEKAIMYAKNAENLYKEKQIEIKNENSSHDLRIRMLLSKFYTYYYEQKKNFVNAFENFKQYKVLSDSFYHAIWNEKTLLKVLYTESLQYQAQLKLQKENQKNKDLMLYVVTALAITLTATVFLFMMNYRLKHKKALAEAQKLESEKALLNSEAERLTQEKQLLAVQTELLESQNRYEHSKAEKLSEELAMQENNAKLREEKMMMQIREKEREMMSIALQINQKNQILAQIRNGLSSVKPETDAGKAQLREIDKIIKSNLSLDNDWEKFSYYFVQVHPNFFKNLLKKYPNLTQNELKHCAFMRVNLSLSETASILGVNTKSVEMARYRIKKKLELSPDDDLVTLMMTIS